MSFTSISFLGFIVVIFCLYFITPKRFRYLTLLVGSYCFYYLVSKGVLVYLLITTVSVFLGGLSLWRYNDDIKTAQGSAALDAPVKAKLKRSLILRKKLVLAAVLLINFGILAVLKYGVMISATLRLALPDMAGQLPVFASVMLPLGISFYTFQATGYLIDIYRGKYEPERNLAKFALFISFFPQIMQGPISRYDDLAHQLYAPHAFDFQRAKNGILLIGWGFIKKLIVADRLAVFVSPVFNSYTEHNGSMLLLAAFVYGLQVYCDFSAGMDIAYGVAQVLGIRMTQNFQQPYNANSIADFWRRWHITLGAWMRDYLFYPLSLSRAFGRLAKAVRKRWGARWSKIIVSGIISFIVFTIVGIWHGAEAKYILYGFWNGGLIMLAILLEPVFNKGLAALHIKQSDWGWRAFRILRTLVLLSVGRSIVCSQGGRAALVTIYKMMFSFAPADLFNGTLGGVLEGLGVSGFDLGVVALVLAVVFFIDHLHEKGVQIRATIERAPLAGRFALYLLMIFALLMLIPTGGNVPSGFIYAQF